MYCLNILPQEYPLNNARIVIVIAIEATTYGIDKQRPATQKAYRADAIVIIDMCNNLNIQFHFCLHSYELQQVFRQCV